MEGFSEGGTLDEIKQLSLEVKRLFSSSSRDQDTNEKWSLLKKYHTNYLHVTDISHQMISSYYVVTSALLDSLKPTLFDKKWQEHLFDEIFLRGISHEAFMILVRKLGELGESYQLQKVLDILQKFLQGSSLESLFLSQCVSNGVYDLRHIPTSKIWDDLITMLVSLPERIANKTRGQMNKIFATNFYIPLIASTVFKVLTSVHDRIANCEDCSLQFIGKLLGRLCVTGNADIIVRKLSVEFVKLVECDFIWRKISQHLIKKMPGSSLESFVTNLLLVLPWYGYVEWILGDETVKNEKLNFIMTVKLLLVRHFTQEAIPKNIIGHFASSSDRKSNFFKILNALLDSWSDASIAKYQSFEQQKYTASSLMICAAWLKELKPESHSKEYIERVLAGTQIRLESSEECIRSLGMIVGNNLLMALDPEAPRLEFEKNDTELLSQLLKLLEIDSKPEKEYTLCAEDLKCFEKVESEKQKWSDYHYTVEENEILKPDINEELDSDDDLEPYDMSNDVPQQEVKRPLYLRDCLQGLIEQENVDWFEQCLIHAENLIKSNSDTVHEVAVEMAEVMLHLDDKFSLQDFVVLRLKILISLTVHCPIKVASYLTAQFYERDYNVSQRLDVLLVLTAASQELSHPKLKPTKFNMCYSKETFIASAEKHWKTIIDHRLKAKTKYKTKTPKKPVQEFQENRFCSVAGYFFFPLLEKYDKESKMLRLFGEDSYVLGRLIYTLGVVMFSAANIPLSAQMGTSLLQFLSDVRNHTDVFVRQAAIFAISTVYVSVPSFLLAVDMCTLVLESQQWLFEITANDPDVNCQMKASHALGIILNIISEEFGDARLHELSKLV